MNTSLPSWLNRKEYPFASHYFDSPAGRMHYVDEGQGDPIVCVHGNPAWSFTWRKLIKGLAPDYRCIAADHIGFGLSDKPCAWSYKPQAHAENLEALLLHLDLRNITLAVNDWGGPTGLSFALKHPDRISKLIVFNTWMWSVKGNGYYEKFSGFMGGAVGRFLIRNFNFFAKAVVRQATGEKERFPKSIRKAYQLHLSTPPERKGSWVFPKEIIGSSDWLDSLWQQREILQRFPALLIWGMKDIAFRKDILETWEKSLHHPQVIRLENTGHYPQEEQGDELVKPIREFLQHDPHVSGG